VWAYWLVARESKLMVGREYRELEEQEIHEVNYGLQ